MHLFFFRQNPETLCALPLLLFLHDMRGCKEERAFKRGATRLQKDERREKAHFINYSKTFGAFSALLRFVILRKDARCTSRVLQVECRYTRSSARELVVAVKFPYSRNCSTRRINSSQFEPENFAKSERVSRRLKRRPRKSQVKGCCTDSPLSAKFFLLFLQGGAREVESFGSFEELLVVSLDS